METIRRQPALNLSLNSTNDIVAFTRFKMLSMVMAAAIFFNVLGAIIWSYKGFPFNNGEFVILLGATFWTPIFIYLLKTKKIDVAYHLFNASLFVFIPLRVFQTGGVFSTSIFAYMAQSIFVFAMSGRKKGLMVFAWNILSIISFSAVNAQSPPSYSPGVTIVSVFLVLLTTVVPIILVLDEKEAFVQRIRAKEKKDSSEKILKSFSQEVKGPLGEARRVLAIAMKGDLAGLENVEENVKKVNHIVKKMLRESELSSDEIREAFKARRK